MKSSIKKSLVIILSIFCFLSVIASASYAYFSSDLKVNGFANVKIELLFDRFDSTALESYQSQFVDDNGASVLTEADNVWGHKGNPYVISEERHLHNLSVLQNIGYFYNKFISNNYDDTSALVGSTNYSDGYDVPYFVVATRTGAPVVIDASQRVIKPIGNDEYPFIGSVTGISGTQATLPTGKTTTTSAIHGVTVETDKSAIDYGLFGLISYLGTEPALEEGTEATTFEGYVSTLQNLLFSDVKVRVVSTIWDDIKDFFESHLFYGALANVSEDNDPEETHHVGIIIGHAEYTRVGSLSIYYSSNDIPAIDVQDAANDSNGNPFNYASATGYIGFMYNLNPVVKEGGITVGSGMSNADVSYGFEGGGGISSGIYPGYIRADQMYNSYSYYAVEVDGETQYQQQTGDIYLIKAHDSTGLSLATAVENVGSTNYYYTDGVFTFALSDGQDPNSQNPEQTLDSLEDIWATNEVDQLQLSSNGWEIGQTGQQIFQYKNLQLVTGYNQLDTTSEYYIGHIDENGAFKFMDLLTSGTTVNARSSNSTLKTSDDGSFFGLRYSSVEDRTTDEKYTIKISNIGTKTNAAGETLNTYTFTSTTQNYSLGVTRTWFLIYIYGLTCSTDGSNRNADYDLVLTPSADGSWTFQRLDVSDGEDSYQGIGFSGTNFSTSWWGGSSSVPIYIYKVLSNVDNVNEAPFTYVPDDANPINLPANQYVLYPQVETSGGATKTATTYEVTSLNDLGWGDSEGNKLWQTDANGNSVINKMFNIKQSVNWSIAINIGGFGFDMGEGGGTVLAPVGSGSYQKQIYIPTGSLAFYINKVPDGGAKIRVIVKVPQNEGTRSLGLDSDNSSEDHYLGIWQGTEKESNSWLSFSSFNVDDAYKKVELPRSHPLISGEVNSHYTNSNGASTANEYLNVTYNNNSYTTMLQGGHYLLAYQFVVNDPGTYILAATDVNMQLAYCSVDGIASAGRDGTGGSPLGDIDFVYDNGSKVLLVTDGGTTTDGVEDPTNYYYESYALLHFVNIDDQGNKHIINNERVCVYRWSGGTEEIKTNIEVAIQTGSSGCTQTDCKHVSCDPIRSRTDNITVTYTPRN